MKTPPLRTSWPGLSHSCPVGVLGPLELHLVCVEVHGELGIEQAVEPPAMHQVGAYEASEGKRAGDGFLGCLSEAQKQEGDEGYGDLDAQGILGGAEKASDFEGLLDPSEEQLDGPAKLVERCDLLGGGVQIVGQDAQHLAAIGLDPDLAHR